MPTPRLAGILLECLQFVRTERAYLLAYAIMPEHLHVLVVPKQPYTVSQVMQSIKGYSSRRINHLLGASGQLWQRSYHDRIIRDDDHLNVALAYIEENPVEAGIVATADSYTWSSAHPDAQTDFEAWLSE